MNYVLDKAFVAECDIAKGAVVVAGANGGVTLPSAANASGIIGAAIEAASEGEAITVRVIGVAECIASAAISAGSLVRVANVAGDLMAIPSTQLRSYVAGVALTAAAGEDEYFDVLLLPSVAGEVVEPVTGIDLTFTAEGDITEGAVVVKGTADTQVKLPASAGAGAIVGVALADAESEDEVVVRVSGLASVVTTAAAVTTGAFVTIAAAAGTVVAGTQPTGTDVVNVVGRAVSGVDSEGGTITIDVAPWVWAAGPTE